MAFELFLVLLCQARRRHNKSRAKFAKFLGGDDMDVEAVGKDILDCAYAIHTRFGSGLLEKAYRVSMRIKL